MATLNTWALPGPLARHVPARMDAIAGHLPSLAVDVVAFQEVWTHSARETLMRAGERSGLVHAWHNEATVGGSGLLVLSRLPIRRARFERFAIRVLPQHIRHIDYFGGKGFVSLQFAAGPHSFTLIDTHLNARYGNDVEHEYRAHRTGQVVELAVEARQSADPLIAVGDFNFQEGDPEYATLVGLTGMRDVAARLDRRQPTISPDNAYRGPGKGDRRVDLIFYRDGLRGRTIPRTVERVFDEPLRLGDGDGAYSDHAGVLAEFELHTGPPKPLPPIDPEVIPLASELLLEGRRHAEQRRRGERALANAGLGGALLATAGWRSPRMSRRRLLRAALGGTGVLTLAPSVGLSILSEVYVPGEIRAFDAVAERLERLAEGGTDAVASRRVPGTAG